MSSKHIEWVDIAKGMGMIFVILGHALPYGEIPSNLIFAFHMPLFFILSGFVYKDYPIKIIIPKRIRTLLVPYILFCLLGTALALIAGGLSIKSLMSDIYYGNPDHIYVSSVWFLVALFFVVCLFTIIRKIKKPIIQYSIILFLLCAGIVYGYLYNHTIINFRLPLDLDVVSVALAFFALGFYLKAPLIKSVEKIKNARIPIYLVIVGAIAIIYILCAIINRSVNLHAVAYRNPLFYIAASISGSLALIFICAKLEGSFISKPLIYVGKNTIYFLGAQAIGIRLSVTAINILFHEQFVLYHLSYPFAVLAFFSTMAFSVVFTVIVKNMWKIIKRLKGVIPSERKNTNT